MKANNSATADPVLTDTHTHLYAEEFDADRDALIEAAGKHGVKRFFLPNIDSRSIDVMLKLSEQYPDRCFPMMGLHPCSVKEDWEQELKLVEEWLGQRKFVAIGEIGIDLYWDKTFFSQQQEAFRRQTRLANEHRLPIVIHTRNSFDETMALLRETPKEEPCGIFHCFTGNAEQARAVVDRGFYIGIGGVATFKNSGLDQVIGAIGLEHLVLETDSPYLAPTPHRGRRNLPEYLRLVAEKVADIKQLTLEEVAAVTTANSKKIFSC